MEQTRGLPVGCLPKGSHLRPAAGTLNFEKYSLDVTEDGNLPCCVGVGCTPEKDARPGDLCVFLQPQ